MVGIERSGGDNSLPKEMFYYSDQLRELLGEEPKYTEYYNKELDQ